MNTLVFIERIGSAWQRFSQTKGYLVMLTMAIIIVSAAILAFLINQAIAPRLESFFDVAFALPKDVANRFSFGLALGISVLAYMVLAARGMTATIAKRQKIENGRIVEVIEEAGKYDMYLLGATILGIEVVSVLVLIGKGKVESEILGGLIMLQVLIGVLLKVAMPMARYSEDIASKNVALETETAHKLASEKALSALQETPTASRPLLGKMPNTNFEVRKSKIA
jgi:hypothetical protein